MIRIPYLLLPAILSLTSAASAGPLELDWEHPTPGSLPMAVSADALHRPYLYAALKNGGLMVMDAARPREVARVGIKSLGDMDVTNFVQRGKTLYLSLGGHFAKAGTKHAGLGIVDVSDPRKPRVVSMWKSPKPMKGAAAVASDGKTAYLAVMSEGVMLFDVSQPSRIRLLSKFLPDVNYPQKNPGAVQFPNARGLALSGDTLFVAYDAGGLRVLDVSNRDRPKEIGRYINQAMGNKQQAYNNLVIEGDHAYIAIDYAGLEIVDIKKPRRMKQVGWWNPWEAHTLKNLWFNSPGHTNQLVLDIRRKLVYLSAGDSELQIVDVSQPSRPKLSGSYGKPRNKLGVWGLGITEKHVLLTYIRTVVPFQGTWPGIKAVKR